MYAKQIMRERRERLSRLLAVWLMSVSWSAAAVGQGDTTSVNVSGTLIDAPECTFASNDVRVDFGDEVITHLVNTGKYIQDIPYELTCNNLSQPGLKMTIKGTSAAFNSLLFSTSNPSLGILIFTNKGDDISPNSEIKFTYGEQPGLTAGLIDNNSTSLQAGYFTGTATLVISYQ